MKILNKRQAIILIVLNSVAVIMAAILIFGGILQRTSQPAGGSPPAEWDVHRAPRASLNEHIVWATNLGGSGDETLLGAYRVGTGLVVFGNTLSDDYDFTGGSDERGFMVTLDASGTVQTLTTFEAVSAVTLHERGYVLTLKAETGVILVSPAGETLKRTVFGGVFPETAVDLKLTTDGYAVVVACKSQNEKTELKVYRLDTELNVKQTVSLSRSGSLEYIDMFELSGKLILSANFVSDVINCLSFIEVLPTPVYHEVTAEFEYKALSVMPYGKGYIALIVDLNSGFGNLLEITDKFMQKSLRYLNAARPASGKLIAGSSYTYAYFHLGADVSTLAVFDYKLDYLNVIADAATLTGLDAWYTQGTSVTFFGRTTSGISVFSADGITTRNAFTVEAPASELRCLKGSAGLLLVGNAYGKGGDCGGNQGGADIWIASVR